ncbi:MAG: hypothetical protein NC186_06225 [Prevotella sp.]|nr:hypothetical protein [Prevotella sp.]
MEDIKKLYIISFSDSRKYRLETAIPEGAERSIEKKPIEDIEAVVKDYLKKRFPDEPLAYFFTPRVEEISWEHRDQYADLPELNDEEISLIEKELAGEVEQMEAVRKVNSFFDPSEVDPSVVTKRSLTP